MRKEGEGPFESQARIGPSACILRLDLPTCGFEFRYRVKRGNAPKNFRWQMFRSNSSEGKYFRGRRSLRISGSDDHTLVVLFLIPLQLYCSRLCSSSGIPSFPSKAKHWLKMQANCKGVLTSYPAQRCFIILRKTRTTPESRPVSSLIGAALSSINSSLPSGRNSTVWFAKPTTTPSRITRSTGHQLR